MLCLICSCVIVEDIHYYLSNMGMEITNTIESQIGYEIESDSEICQQCLVSILPIVDKSKEISVTRHACVWCRATLFKKRSHWIPKQLRPIVLYHISPRMIPEGALLCMLCWERVRKIAQNQNQEYEVSSNTNICVRCQVSLYRRRSHALSNGLERNHIADIISPRQIPPGGRVCWRCWISAYRHTKRKHEQPSKNAMYISSLSNKEHKILGKGPEQEITSKMISSIVAAQKTNTKEILSPPTILLLNYKKAISSRRHCFVPDCINTERYRVSDFMRKHIFITKKVFISLNSCVCKQHKEVYDWDVLDEYDFSHIFTQNEIEQIFELLST